MIRIDLIPLLIEHFLLNRNLFFLLHSDIVLFLQILPSSIGRFFVNFQSMTFTDIQEHCPAGRIKNNLTVICL